MSNLPDEDEEFLYGDAEMEASDSNRQIGAKNGIQNSCSFLF
jgi:hypothetical protein